MNKDELLDLVNKKDEVIGTVWKSEAHKNPKLIHREIAVAVFNQNGEVLLQRRSLNKSKGPGKWQITVAGHISAGEDPRDAVAREVYEELGFKIKPVYFTKEFWRSKDGNEARFFWIYYSLIKSKPVLKPDMAEVMDTKWIKPSEIENFINKNNYSIDHKSFKMIIKLSKFLFS